MKLGVIGCGKMGTAFVAGAIRSGVVVAADVIGIDPIKAARDQFAEATGAQVAEEISALASLLTPAPPIVPHVMTVTT